MRGQARPESEAPGVGQPGPEQASPTGLAYFEQAAQQAQLRQYGVLAALGQLALARLPFPRLARESLVQLLEALELSSGALLELLPEGGLHCVASFGAPLASGTRLEAAALGPWRAYLATPSRTAEVFGHENAVPLTPLASGAEGLLVRVPSPTGVTVAVLALAALPERRFGADALAFLQAAAHLLGAAFVREREDEGQREEVSRLRALLDFAPTPMVLKELDGRYLYLNRRAATALRRPVEELVGRTDEDVFSAETARMMREHEEAVRASGCPLEFEEEIDLPEGRRTFMAMRFPILDAHGRMNATGFVATDITGVKRIEQELRHSEEQLRLLLDGLSGIAIFMLDPEGRVATWNRGAERLKGYRAEDVLGVPAYVLTEGESGTPEALGRMRARAEAEGRSEVELWCIRKDGSRFLSSETLFPLWTEDRRLRGFSMVSQDITERRRAEKQVAQSETRYRLVSRATHEAIWDWDVTTDTVEWGEGAMSRLGYPEDEAASHPSWWVMRIHPEDRERVLSGLVHVVEEGGEQWSAEYRFLRADGSYAAVLDLGYVVREDGGPRRVIGAMADITRRKRAEEERARLYREAQEAIRLRDEFLSVASHELKTPLTTLQLHLQTLHALADKDGSAFTPERASVKLALAEQQVQRLSKLVNDLLDISRLTAGRMELRFETINVGSLLQELVERQRSTLGRSGSEVRLELRDPGVARVDPMRLEQVLINLLSNAAKYGQGKPIDVTLEGDAASYVVRVCDRGIGIAPEDQRRIFERFERAVSERHYGGLGLGLWIARQIVLNLGGTIEVRSEPGQGATFEVRLPRFPPEVSLSELAGPPAPG